MDRIRILQVISGLDIGEGHGGAERFGLELARALNREKFQVEICAFWKRNTQTETFWLEKLTSDGIPLFFASEWKGKFSLSSYLKGVAALVSRTNEKEYVLLSSHFQMGTIASLLAKLLSRGKVRAVVRTAHISLEWGEGLVAWLMRRITTDWLFPIALDLEIGVSSSIKNQLARHPGARLFRRAPLRIYNAYLPDIETNASDEQTSIKSLIDANDIVVGSIGRLTRQKGYNFLLRAAPKVLRDNPNVKFVLIGTGEDLESLKDLAKALGVESRILFAGKVNDVYPLLRRMDLFVLPSLWEGFPTVLLESLASEVPVIATNVDGTNELIRNGFNGWLVQSSDSDALSRAITEALADETKRQAFAKNGLQTVRSYTIARIGQQYERQYEMLAQR